jgi:hypothetical protein
MISMINKAIISGAVAFLFFNKIETSWLYYAIVFLTAWILISINFSLSKNHSFFKSLLTVNVAVFIVYCINNRIKNGSITQPGLDELFFIIVLGVMIVTGYILLAGQMSAPKKQNIKSILINKREKDLISLLSYVESFQIIGLNGRWGTGKSFIINALKEKIKDQYEFIEIDLMTCNLNEMQPTLIRAFEEVMYKNNILPKYANKMKKNIASSSLISKIKDLTDLIFTNSDSNSEVLHEFQKELKKLDKKILVIYEDIDRISNKDVIKEIFSISEKISNENVKIIYQYDEYIMEKELEFNANYLEKYIPFKINLTELNFWEVLQFELIDVDESLLSLEDFKFIRYPHQFNVLQDFFGFSNDYVLEINYIPIRKVKHLVGEILIALRMKQDLYSNHKETVISFFLLKHLYSDGYKKLDIRESLLETMKFKVDDNNYNIFQLIELYKQHGINNEKLKDTFIDEQNRENYGLLKLFKYEIINPEKYKDASRFRELEESAKHKNEKINRILWNLLYEGKSIFTDFENTAVKFNEDVLIKPLLEQKEAFQYFWNYFYYSDSIVTDNTTIFKLGSPNLLELFKCFKIANLENEIQIKLIAFYFQFNDIEEFKLEVVECMNYCPLNSTEEYLSILNYLNSLEVLGNLIKKEEFTQFLNKYIHALSRLGFINSYEYFDDINIYNQEYLLVKFGLLLEDLEKVKARQHQVRLSSTVEDLDIIIQFVQKLIQIITCETEIIIESRPEVSSEITIRKRNQEEFDRLKQLFVSEADNRFEEIEASYKNKKINLYEIDVLLLEVQTS